METGVALTYASVIVKSPQREKEEEEEVLCESDETTGQMLPWSGANVWKRPLVQQGCV